MSVRAGLLALLAETPMYGAQVRARFEERTGSTWPLNIGQVYTTLARLERDGLVEQDGEPDAEGRKRYRLTERGLAEAAAWWATPVARGDAPRDELVIKLSLAVSSPGVDVERLVQRQRVATITHLRDLTALKRDTHERAHRGEASEQDIAWLLVVENLIFSAEAEVRWLDHMESRLVQFAAAHTRRAAAGGDAVDQGTTAPPPATEVPGVARPGQGGARR